MDRKSVVDRLQSLGYLKYVDPQGIPAVRAQMEDSIDRGFLDTEWDDDSVSADRRSYPADAEELAEGNFGEVLNLMTAVLHREGVRLDSVEDDFTEDHYSVIVNAAPHVIWSRAEVSNRNLWAIATRRCLELVNGLLQKANSAERLWGVYGGNDGRFLFLTPEMHGVLSQPALKLDRKGMPYPPTDPRLTS